MVTDAELEFVAQCAETYPKGHGHHWFWETPFGFFLDPEDDVKEAEAVLHLHPTWDEYGEPSLRLTVLRCRQHGWKVTVQELLDTWAEVDAELSGEYVSLLNQDPEALARRLRARIVERRQGQ